MKRRYIFRALAIAVILAVAVIMFIIGRGHTVYFDNKAFDYDGKSYKALYKVQIMKKGERIAKLYEKERGMMINIGQRLPMLTFLVIREENGAEEAFDVAMPIPYNMDGVIINVPALLEGLPQDAYISEFISTEPEPEEEETLTDEFGIGVEEPAN